MSKIAPVTLGTPSARTSRWATEPTLLERLESATEAYGMLAELAEPAPMRDETSFDALWDSGVIRWDDADQIV